MRFVIAVDLEGIACVVGTGAGLGDGPNYAFACKQAVREVNAAAAALFEAGAQQVIVWDNHSSGVNLDYDKLDRRLDIANGAGVRHRFCFMDESFSGIVLIGYHPMDNTENGVLAHTYSSTSYQWVKIGGVEVGEMEIDAAMAGEKGVPIILVSSCEKGAQEAKRFFPWAETVAVKTGYSWYAAVSMHPERAAQAIYEGAKRAAQRLDQMQCFTLPGPFEMEIRFKRINGADANRIFLGPDTERIDAYTISGRVEKLSDIY